MLAENQRRGVEERRDVRRRRNEGRCDGTVGDNGMVVQRGTQQGLRGNGKHGPPSIG